ncbi:MAG: disulfide bond formation protein B [Planctomycetota bacterium]|nr:disulfide bond formation protein B [Planctomycetota bacterium]
MSRFLQLFGYWTCHFNILTVSSVLLGAYYIQFAEGEFPCPLCILQRMAMLLTILGSASILLASRQGPIEFHSYSAGYGMSVLGAVIGSIIALRQIALHIAPGDPGYGSPAFGLHLYTWALIVFGVVAAVSGVNLAWTKRFNPHAVEFGWASKCCVGLVALLMLSNAIIVFIEAGFHISLPDNPTCYQLFVDLGWTTAPLVPAES